MDIPAMAKQVGQSVLDACLLTVILAALYPYLPESGPFGIQNLFEQVINFAVPTIVVGVGAVAWWLYDEGF